MKNLKNMGTQTKVANTPTLCACELSLLNSTYWIWTRQLAQRSNVAFGFSLLGVELVSTRDILCPFQKISLFDIYPNGSRFFFVVSLKLYNFDNF